MSPALQPTSKVWAVSRGNPVKQSNFGLYKQVISAGTGMNLRRVTITGDTAEIVQEVAHYAAGAVALMAALEKARGVVQMVDDAAGGQIDLLSSIDAALVKAQGGAA